MYLIMNCWDENITDADHPHYAGWVYFLEIIHSPLKKIWGTLKSFKTNYQWLIPWINLTVLPIPEF